MRRSPLKVSRRSTRHAVGLNCQVVRERDFRLIADRIVNLSASGLVVSPADPALTADADAVFQQLASLGKMKPLKQLLQARLGSTVKHALIAGDNFTLYQICQRLVHGLHAFFMTNLHVRLEVKLKWETTPKSPEDSHWLSCWW